MSILFLDLSIPLQKRYIFTVTIPTYVELVLLVSVRCVSNLECIVGLMPPVIYPSLSAEPGKVRQSESQTVKAFELSSSAEPSEPGCGERERI